MVITAIDTLGRPTQLASFEEATQLLASGTHCLIVWQEKPGATINIYN